MPGQRRFAGDDEERGAAFRACLGQDERAIVKIERGQVVFAGELRASRLPVQSPRDHQVQHEP